MGTAANLIAFTKTTFKALVLTAWSFRQASKSSLASTTVALLLLSVDCQQVLASQGSDRALDDRPNIVLILVDDLGKEWVGCYGAEDVKTPHIDQLASSGMKFNHFYVMPQCTPTRLSLLTGQYPFRHGWVNHWDVPRWGGGCHYDWKQNPCLARMVKDAGYRTAIAGKWQINDFRVQPDALNEMGFDEYLMWTGGEGGNPKSNERYWEPYLHGTDGSSLRPDEFGPDLFCDFLSEFIDENRDSPFFIYYPMVLTHPPLVPTPHIPDATSRLDKHRAMVEYTDHLTGRLVEQLEESGVRKRTIIIWTTDNGTSKGIIGKRNGQEIAGQKSETTEAGVCVPFIVNCPGMVPVTENDQALSDITDLYPTIAKLVEAKPDDQLVDGVSQRKVWFGEQDSSRHWIMAMGGKNNARLTDKGVENQYRYRDRVLRTQRFKLYVNTSGEPEKLVDLAEDPTEEKNLLASDSPAAKEALQLLLAEVAKFPEVDADPIYTPLPPQNWDVPVRAKSQVWKK